MSDNEIMESEASVSEAEPEVTEEAQAQESASEEDALVRLSREVSELRALVESRQAREAAEVPSASDEPWQPALTDDFRALYPDLAADDVPDAVWENVRAGLPLEAAYALWERREAVRRVAAADVNQRNAAGAWGRAERAPEDFLSPDEVRSMTRDEVRKHYSRIVESMKHWN